MLNLKKLKNMVERLKLEYKIYVTVLLHLYYRQGEYSKN